MSGSRIGTNTSVKGPTLISPLSPALALSILTDWLEAKFSGGEERVESSDMPPAGALQTLTISNGLRELDQRTHKVHVCIKVA